MLMNRFVCLHYMRTQKLAWAQPIATYKKKKIPIPVLIVMRQVAD